MTSSPTHNTFDERRAAWKLDDPEWVKQRKKDWRDVKDSPIFKRFDKDHLKRCKNFFLTGIAFNPEPEEEEWNLAFGYHPMIRPLPAENSLLIECWLDPNPSDERWEKVKQRTSEKSYLRARSFFRGCLYEANRQGNFNVFSGLDERLYYFFGPTRCRKSDALIYNPDLTDEQYHGHCRNVYADLVWQVRAFLEPECSPDLIAPAFLEEWCDTIAAKYDVRFDKMLKYDKKKYASLKQTVSSAINVIEHPTLYEDRQVSFAERLIHRFNTMDMPRNLAHEMTPLLGK